MRAKRLFAVCISTLVLASLVFPPLAGAYVSARTQPAVVVVLAPYLRWSDIDPQRTPALWKLAERGAVGNMNSQTRDQDWPPVVRGALTFSAGAWAGAPTDALSAYDANETFSRGFTARSLYESLFATRAPNGAGVLYLGSPAAQKDNAGALTPVKVGLLADVLHATGHPTAAFGNSDTSEESFGSAHGAIRPAGIVAADGRGVTTGDVGPGMLVADPSAPFGKRTNYPRLIEKVKGAIRRFRGTRPLVVVDTGDLMRARDASAAKRATAAPDARARAVAGLDGAIGTLMESSQTPSPTIMVVAPAVEQQAWNQPELAPIILAGEGIEPGLLTSSSTHRAGLVSNLDVTPTLLELFETPLPPELVGSSMIVRPAPEGGLAASIAGLEAANAFALATDAVRDPFVDWWIWGTLAVFAVALLLVWRRLEAVRPVERGLLLAVLALPPATFLAVIPVRYARTGMAVTVAVIGWAFALWAMAVLLTRVRRWPQLAPLFLTALTAGLVTVDQFAHRPWAESSIFSYSVLAGWRYYGVGNEASGFAVAAALIALGLGYDAADGARGRSMLRLFGVPVVAVAVIAALAGPMFGANAGVAVWGLVGFAVLWAMLAEVRLTWKVALIALAAVALVVAGLVALDVARGAGEQTHLGRLVVGLLRGNTSVLTELVTRKAFNAWTYSRDTVYTWLALGSAAALAGLWFGASARFKRLLAENRGLAAAVAGVIAASACALLTEDSGTAMPAVMLAPLVATVLFEMLAPSGDEADERSDTMRQNS